MTKEKIASLTKYAQDLKNRLSDKTPVKHKDHPDTYKAYLLHELELVNSALDKAKMV